jgi:hypothetical protein
LRNIAGDLDGLADFTDLQLRVNVGGGVNLNEDIWNFGSFKASIRTL